MRSAVLFLIFNRPETTRQVFEAIRAAQPPRLYVAADGPRIDRAGEVERCAEARRIATAVDWACDVQTLFRDQNLGCKVGVSTGISWFFEHEAEGIILEDDVLPLPSFFPYCDELLERYRDDDRIALVSGCNLIAHRFTPPESYFYSIYNHIWGWASWRRAWKHYDVAMSDWPAWRDSGGLCRLSNGRKSFEEYWREIFDAVSHGEIDTWDYQWTFTCWRLGALSILPSRNQTYNIGFGPSATHTKLESPSFVRKSRPKSLDLPLVHPVSIGRSEKIDWAISRRVFGIARPLAAAQRISKTPLVNMFARLVRIALNKVKASA